MESKELVKKLRKFIESEYSGKLDCHIRKGEYRLTILFKDMQDAELREELEKNPEDFLKTAELIIKEISDKNFKVRIKGIPRSWIVRIRDILSKDLNKFVRLEGYIKAKSSVRPNIVSAKFECKSCLPKGTLVHTPKGLKPIEKAKEVLCVDYDFKLTKIKAKVIHTGKKQIWKINKDIICSGEHKWFVCKNGITKVIQTKDLNIGDTLYKFNYGNMYNMCKRIQATPLSQERRNNENFKKEDMFDRMQKEILQPVSKGRRKDTTRQQKDNNTLQRRQINDSNSHYVWDAGKSPYYKEEINKIQDSIKDRFGTMQNQFKEFQGVQAWKEMWRKKLSEVGKTKLSVEMPDVRNREGEISKKGIGCPPQKWKSRGQQIGEFDSIMSIMLYKITSLKRMEEKIDMYDLQVPDYNNFILSNGIISHNCGNIINVIQLEDKFKEPSVCRCGRKGKFYLADKELVDAYSILLEELPENLKYGTQLSKIKVMLKHDLCDANIEERIFQGVKVSVTGYLKEIMMTNRKGQTKIRMDIYLEANYVDIMDSTSLDIKLSHEDIKEIKGFIEEGNVLRRLKKIIYKSVYGLEKEKEGMIHACVEGKTDMTKAPIIRGKIHILMIGDPSVGKTTLRQALQPFLVKWRRVSGKGTTGVGIIGAVIRDELTDNWSFEVGDLALADRAILFIDELDKLPGKDRDALHQPLEELEIDISKANIHTTLLARTTIIAGANPKYGRFDPYGDFYEQLNLADTLVNRFDLVFALPQKMDEEAIKEEGKKAQVQLDRDNIETTEEEITFVKKFLAFALKLKPVMSQPVKKHIVEKFERLLAKGLTSEKKSIPINQRQVGAIKRLAEAHAKLTHGHMEKEGAVEVTKRDVDYAIDLIYYCYKQIAFDYETGQIDMDKITTGVTSSQRSHIAIIKGAVRNLKEKFNNMIPIEDLIEDVVGQGVDRDRVEEIIEKIKTAGDLYEPRAGFLQELR